MTNYEQFKNMSVEELSNFLMDWFMNCMSGKAPMNVKQWLESEVGEMKKFEEMTDQELIDFCYENMLDVKVCKALGCKDWCKEQDCPMFQCLNRFENYIKAHPTEKGGE